MVSIFIPYRTLWVLQSIYQAIHMQYRGPDFALGLSPWSPLSGLALHTVLRALIESGDSRIGFYLCGVYINVLYLAQLALVGFGL